MAKKKELYPGQKKLVRKLRKNIWPIAGAGAGALIGVLGGPIGVVAGAGVGASMGTDFAKKKHKRRKK